MVCQKTRQQVLERQRIKHEYHAAERRKLNTLLERPLKHVFSAIESHPIEKNNVVEAGATQRQRI
jgi:hypothetical protein